MKIVFFHWGPHHQAAWDYLYKTLEKKGFNPISHSGQENGKKIDHDTDIVFVTSDRDLPIKNPKTKIFFIPHGIGLEAWEKPMDHFDLVFLTGKKPFTPPSGINNWKIVGWSKSDILFHAEKEEVEKAKIFISKFPYDHTILFVPPLSPNDLPYLDFVVKNAQQKKLNLIIPFRKRSQGYSIQEAQKRYGKFKHVQIPDILNLYYFAPYIRVCAAMGLTSVTREFYITNIPTLHAGFGFEESHFSYPIKRDYPKFLEEALRKPEKYGQSPQIIKQFFGYFDGKTTERIIKEIEKVA